MFGGAFRLRVRPEDGLVRQIKLMEQWFKVQQPLMWRILYFHPQTSICGGFCCRPCWLRLPLPFSSGSNTRKSTTIQVWTPDHPTLHPDAANSVVMYATDANPCLSSNRNHRYRNREVSVTLIPFDWFKNALLTTKPRTPPTSLQRLLPEPARKHQRWRDAPWGEVFGCRRKWWVIATSHLHLFCDQVSPPTDFWIRLFGSGEVNGLLISHCDAQARGLHS